MAYKLMHSEIRNSNSICLRNNARTSLTRRCRTDESDKINTKGQYYPNFLVSTLLSPKPLFRPSGDLINGELNYWILDNDERKRKLVQKSGGTAMLYVAYTQGGPEFRTTCSSWWILEHNGKRVGVSALHILDDTDLNSVQLFISRSYESRFYDKFTEFEQRLEENTLEKEFLKLNLRLDLLSERANLIKKFEKDTEFMQQHNLDPEFGLQPHPTIDILFTSVPTEDIHLPAFNLSIAPMKANEIFAHIGYHNDHEPTQPALYKETIKNPPKARELLYPGRSVSLGRVIQSSSILTVISTNAEGSSGGCMVDDNLGVFAISCSSFYDDPTAVEENEISEQLPINPLLYDLNIPEKGQPNQRAPRNRNLALSLFHPIVQEILKQI